MGHNTLVRRSARLAVVVAALSSVAFVAGCATVGTPRASATQVAAPSRRTVAPSRAQPVLPVPLPSRTGWVANLTPTHLLELVSPTGAHTPVATVPAGLDLLDVTADTRRFLFIAHPSSTLRVYDAGTSRWADLPVRDVDGARFTRPGGAAVIVTREVGDQGALVTERRDLSGELELTLSRGDWEDAAVLPAPDGLTYLTTSGAGFAVHDNGTGRLVRLLASPRGQRCTASRWWSDSTVQAYCTDASAGSTEANVYLFPATGAPVTRLTSMRPQDLGMVSAWPSPRGTVLGEMPLCGPGRFGMRTPTGGFSPLTLQTGRTRPALTTVVGSRLYLLLVPDCDGGSSTLATYDLQTRRLTREGASTGFAVVDPLR